MSFLKALSIKILLLGAIIGSSIAFLTLPTLETFEWWPGHTSHHHSTDYHAHTDFLVVLAGEVIDFSDERYMTNAVKKLHDDVHLHDSDGKVAHYHAPNISFATFLTSLGLTLSDTCLTVASDTICTNDTNEVALYVNGDRYPDYLTSYIPTDLDRILLLAGPISENSPEKFLNQVEDRACIFSGSCPERGTAPPESCGLTCEL